MDRVSYLHLTHDRLPRVLAELHRGLAIDAPVQLSVARSHPDGSIGDTAPAAGTNSRWEPDDLGRVVTGGGFTVDAVSVEPHHPDRFRAVARRARTLPDFVGPGMRLLLCGLNPSLRAADAGVGFVTPGNRFWPAALASGLVSRDRDPFHALDQHHVGMTDLVKRATARADELSRDEYAAGAARVRWLVAWLRPGAICFVGLSGYRAAVDRRAQTGVQPEPFGGVPTYVMPNPSGLNASATPAILTDHLRAAARLADESIGA